MTDFEQWAYEWSIPIEAIADLRARMTDQSCIRPLKKGDSETDAQNEVRFEAAQQYGFPLWRNNVGALKDLRGVPVRYGLANDSKALNEKYKSSDLIGVQPVYITPAMVGSVIGRFVAREIKEPGWQFTGSLRERAQLAFLQHVASLGGDAAFATGPGSLTPVSTRGNLTQRNERSNG